MQNARKPLPIQSMSNMPIAIQNKIKPSIRFTGYLHFERILTRKGFFFEKNRVYYRTFFWNHRKMTGSDRIDKEWRMDYEG